MKVKEAMTLIDEGWIRKRKGYRVRYQHWVEGRLLTGHSPELEGEALLPSEVSARRLAWKLSQCGLDDEDPEFFNLMVIDDLEQPVKSYVTGEVEIFNPRDVSAWELSCGDDKEADDHLA